MLFNVWLLSALLGLFSLFSLSDANVIRSTNQLRGFCCTKDCGICHPSDIERHHDDSPIESCWNKTKVNIEATGTETFYNPAGEEVKIITFSEGTTEHGVVERQPDAPGHSVARGDTKPRGWCCTDNCDICYPSTVECYGRDDDLEWCVLQTQDPQLTSCCFLGRKMDASTSFLEKLYSPVTGHEVIMITPSKDVPVLAERQVTPSKNVVALAERQPDPPEGLCCVSECKFCQVGARCMSPDYDCNRWLWTPVCCMSERKVDSTGAEKLYSTLTGDEIQLVTSPEQLPLGYRIAEPQLGAPAQVLTERSEEVPVEQRPVDLDPEHPRLPMPPAGTPGRPSALSRPPAQITRETHDEPGADIVNSCCTRGCHACSAVISPICNVDNDCMEFSFTRTCCQLKRVVDGNGDEKWYSVMTGQEVQLLEHEDYPTSLEK